MGRKENKKLQCIANLIDESLEGAAKVPSPAILETSAVNAAIFMCVYAYGLGGQADSRRPKVSVFLEKRLLEASANAVSTPSNCDFTRV